MSDIYSKEEEKLKKMLDEHKYIHGAHSRTKEFLFAFKVAKEFINGFRVLHFLNPCIAFFGSARMNEGDKYYELARETAKKVSQLGFTIMTGGGPGIMEAASRGGKEGGGTTVGINITLPHEQKCNPHLDKTISCDFFFVRKVLMFKYSYGFVILPGGMGTIDEFFEILTLVQTHKTGNYPIIVMGGDYWKNIREMLEVMVAEKTINREDIDYIKFTDDPDEVTHFLNENAIKRFNLKSLKRFNRAFLFGEK